MYLVGTLVQSPLPDRYFVHLALAYIFVYLQLASDKVPLQGMLLKTTDVAIKVSIWHS